MHRHSRGQPGRECPRSEVHPVRDRGNARRCGRTNLAPRCTAYPDARRCQTMASTALVQVRRPYGSPIPHTYWSHTSRAENSPAESQSKTAVSTECHTTLTSSIALPAVFDGV